MSKITLKGHIVVSADNLSAVMTELPTHVELTRQEPGCLVFEVIQDIGRKNVFNVYEEFTDRQAFEQHQLRVKNSSWGRMAAGVERHYQVSEDPVKEGEPKGLRGRR